MIILILSCTNKHVTNSKSVSNEATNFKSTLRDVSDSIPYYLCDDYYAFTIRPNTKNIDSLYHGLFACTKETIVNRQDSSVIDTIYNYSHKNNIIKIYKSFYSGDLLLLFDVMDSNFEINSNIKPGISKAEFIKKFNIQSLQKDTVDIGNIERTDVIRFYFKHDILRRIYYEPYLD